MASFNKEKYGLEVYPKGSSLNIRKIPSTTGEVLFTIREGELAGKLTGYYMPYKDGIWYQIMRNNLYGYVREDVIKLSAPNAVTKADAFNVIQKLVESDKLVYESLLRSSIILEKLKSQDTSQYQKKFNELLARLSKRQEDIIKSNLVKASLGFNKLLENAKKAITTPATSPNIPKAPGMLAPISPDVSFSGIGAAQGVIIISVSAGAALMAAAYFVFKPKYDESSVDLKISTELESLLKKTDPATAKKITDNLEKQIDDAYNTGKTEGTFGGVFKILLPIGLLFGGYFLITNFVKKQAK